MAVRLRRPAKVHSQTLNLFIVEQLPVIAPAGYDRRFGAVTARELVRDHVLRLTYTAHDLAPFARDLGCDGPPFPWDPEQRRHLRARLDALYFHLYGRPARTPPTSSVLNQRLLSVISSVHRYAACSLAAGSPS